jgi:hypothetical protein
MSRLSERVSSSAAYHRGDEHGPTVDMLRAVRSLFTKIE